MSRIAEVLRNKNRVEKIRRSRRKDELTELRMDVAFKARLHEELKRIDILFKSDDVESVVVNIPDKFLARFGAALYSGDLAEYNVQQVDGTPNKFYIRRRFISF